VLAGCGAFTAAQPPPKADNGEEFTAAEEADRLVSAERALAVGNSIRALKLVENVVPQDPQYDRASDILDRARYEVESVTVEWIDRIDTLIGKEQYRAADERLSYLLKAFPLAADLKAEAEERRRQIIEGMAKSDEQVAKLDREATEQLLRRDLAGAATSLKQAVEILRNVDPTRAYARERALETVLLRIEQQAAEARGEGAEKGAYKTHRPMVKKKKPTPAQAVKAPEPAPPPPAGDVAKEQRVAELLKDAAKFQKEKNYFQAIVTYLEVRRQDVKNDSAKVALEALEPKRQALIKENLAKANEHFLKQDLAGAVPYYKKVRELDPANEQAREGLEMYENLARIRGNQPR